MVERNSENAAEKIEAAMLSQPVFVTTKRYDPIVYNSAINSLHEEARSGASAEEMLGGLYTRIIALETKRITTAPDEALIPFERTIIAELRALNVQDSDACFSWLYPSLGKRVQISSYISKSLIDDNHLALARVIQSSIENPQPVPVLADVTSDLQLVQARLAKVYGDEAGILDRVSGPNIDKKAVCYMTGNLRSNILELPEVRAGKLLRYLYSKQLGR